MRQRFQLPQLRYAYRHLIAEYLICISRTVVVWLRSLGLGRYEAAFRENEIDETVLPSLTHETLKELGVTAVGHRLKLLDAIAALRNDASGQTQSVDAKTASSTPSVRPEDRAERRQVTVMFSDLVRAQRQSRRGWTWKTVHDSTHLGLPHIIVRSWESVQEVPTRPASRLGGRL